MKMRRIFCKHKWPAYWTTSYKDDKPVVIFYQRCEKCGKRREFQMPLENVEPAHQEYLRRKKSYRV